MTYAQTSYRYLSDLLGVPFFEEHYWFDHRRCYTWGRRLAMMVFETIEPVDFEELVDYLEDRADMSKFCFHCEPCARGTRIYIRRRGTPTPVELQ